MIVIRLGIVTNFYGGRGTLENILVEAHGSLVELLLVTVVASFLIARRSRRKWQPSRDVLLARLLTELNRLLDSLLPDSLQSNRSTHIFYFGHAESHANKDYQSINEEEAALQVSSQELKNENDERYLIVGSSLGYADQQRIERFNHLEQRVSKSYDRLQTLADLARALADHSVPTHIVSRIAQVEYTTFDLLDTLELFRRSGFKAGWASIGHDKGKLTKAALALFKAVADIAESSESLDKHIESLISKPEESAHLDNNQARQH